jgi:hypothetical protein
MEEIEAMVDILKFSKIPMGRFFSELVEQVGPDRLRYMHDKEFIKILEKFYND